MSDTGSGTAQANQSAEATEKRCWMCGEVRPMSAFARDASRPDGYSYRCKRCTARYQKERRKHAMRKRGAIGHYDVAMMTREVFALCWCDERLKGHIQREAHYLTKNRTLQDDLVAVAWARIAQCLAGQSTSYYCREADKAMRQERWKDWAQRHYHLRDDELLSRAEYDYWKRGVP